MEKKLKAFPALFLKIIFSITHMCVFWPYKLSTKGFNFCPDIHNITSSTAWRHMSEIADNWNMWEKIYEQFIKLDLPEYALTDLERTTVYHSKL